MINIRAIQTQPSHRIQDSTYIHNYFRIVARNFSIKLNSPGIIMRFADFHETLTRIEWNLPRASSFPSIAFFARLSLYRSEFFIRQRASSTFIHGIKRVISFRDATSVIEKYMRARADALLFPGCNETH